MISIKTILVFAAVTLVVGTSGVLGVFEDGAYFAMCGGCSEGAQAFGGSLSAILTAGQSDVVFGVNGLLELQAVMDNQEKAVSLDNIFQGNFTGIMINGLIWLYWIKIILGSVLTLIYIWILIKIIKLPFTIFAGWEPPIFVIIFLAIAVTGLLHWGFSGWTQFPFQGWITLAQHPELWSAKAIESISPLPPEALHNLTYPNSTVELPT
jgi:uncharacterized integral membrane protein